MIRRLVNWWRDRRDPFGRNAHDTWGKRHGHSCKNGHFCDCWDGLYICEDCPEARHCYCFGPALNQKPYPIRGAAMSIFRRLLCFFGLHTPRGFDQAWREWHLWVWPPFWRDKMDDSVFSWADRCIHCGKNTNSLRSTKW